MASENLCKFANANHTEPYGPAGYPRSLLCFYDLTNKSHLFDVDDDDDDDNNN